MINISDLLNPVRFRGSRGRDRYVLNIILYCREMQVKNESLVLNTVLMLLTFRVALTSAQPATRRSAMARKGELLKILITWILISPDLSYHCHLRIIQAFTDICYRLNRLLLFLHCILKFRVRKL